MDEIDLEKQDPKRVSLEQDKIIVEYVKTQFQNYLDLYANKADFDLERSKKEPEPFKKNILIYQYEQKTYLTKIIEAYQEQINLLNKEDSL